MRNGHFSVWWRIGLTFLGLVSSRATTPVSAADAAPVSVPLEFGADGLPVVVAVVDGVKARLLLDTGGANVLKMSLYQRLRPLPPAATAEAIKKQSEFTVALGTWRHDNARFMPISDEVFDLTGDLDGMLGAEFFYDKAVRWNFSGKTLTILPTANLRGTAGEPKGTAVALLALRTTVRGGTLTPQERADPLQGDEVRNYFVPVSGDATSGEPVRLNLCLDTGAVMTVFNGGKEADRLRRLSTVHNFAASSLYGEAPGDLLRLPRLSVGGATIARPVVAVVATDFGADWAGSLGMDTLRRYRLTMDFPGKMLYLEPDAAFHDDPYRWNSVGIVVGGLEAPGPPPSIQGLYVARVMVPSPASKAGLRGDDELVSINGASCTRMDPTKAERFWQKAAGSPVSLVIQRKGERQTRRVTLKVVKLL